MSTHIMQDEDMEDEDPDFWLWVTAHHEAAHAVAYCQQGLPFRYVTIRPRRDGIAGQVALRRARVIRSSALSLIAAAGPIAELHCCLNTPSDSDLGRAFADPPESGDLETYAKATAVYPPSVRVGIWRAHERFVTDDLWSAVEAVAAALLASPRALTYRDVERICSPLLYSETTGS